MLLRPKLIQLLREIVRTKLDLEMAADDAMAYAKDTDSRLSQRIANRNKFAEVEKRSVYFDFNKATIKPESRPALDDAAKIVPLNQLGVAPQCGFSSTVHGNDIAVEAQRAKLALVVDIAREVWG